MIITILFFLTLVQVVYIGTVMLLENRDPSKTVAWLFILSLLPVIGIILYIVFGRQTRGQELFQNKHLPGNPLAHTVHQQQHNDENVGGMHQPSHSEWNKKFTRLLLNSGSAPLTRYNHVDILTNGNEKFMALFNSLEEAKHHIHLCYYSLRSDEIGEDVLKILARKVSEGVEVRVIVDGLGSHSISGAFMQRMRQAGIQAEWFFPVRFPYITPKLNLRNHRKIVVVDGQTGFMGGLNIGDEYLSRDPKLGFWRDTHLKLEGEAVHALQSIFLNDWFFVTHEKIQGEAYFPEVQVTETQGIQVVASGPDSNWASILQGFFSALTLARDRIIIETPYFIPDESLIMALKTAALSGLDVRVIVQGVPEHQLTYWASHSYYEELLQAGVKIFKYNKGILHAKVLIIDQVLACVGSANVDIRSFNLDFEISAFLYGEVVAVSLMQDLDQDIRNSMELDLAIFQKRPFIDRLKESYARLLSPLL